MAIEFVDHLKSQVDIVQVVGEYVRLTKAGPRYKGLCPFHSEKTPSFHVHAALQFYICFGCGAKGNVIGFVMEIEGLSFWEAAKSLAERYGIPVPKRTQQSSEEDRQRAAFQAMHEEAARLFAHTLHSPAGAEARAYLERRGVKKDGIEEFGLGMSERSGQALCRRLQQSGFSPDQMEAAGLVLKRQDGSGYYDRFRGRLMFPIHNETGKIIAFAGRAMAAGDEPKYLNSPETAIYKKTYVLYNLHRARKPVRDTGFCVLVEGYMDVIGLQRAGVCNVVASCGTALTSNQVRSLKRHAEQIVVNFDPDSAGSAAAERSIQMLLDESMSIRVLELPGGEDPDEFVLHNGAEAYREQLGRAARYFDWLAIRARRRFDVRSPEGRTAALQFLLPVVQRIPGKLERVAVAGEVAAMLGVETGMVLDEFRKLAVGRKQEPMRVPEAPAPAAERLLVFAMLQQKESREAVLARLRPAALPESLATRPILEAFASLGGDFDYAALESRLDDRGRALLASIAFADELSEQEISQELALECLAKLEEAREASGIADIKSRLKAAERAGDMQEVLRLEQDLRRVELTARRPVRRAVVE